MTSPALGQQASRAAVAPASTVLLATAGGHRSAKALDSVIGAALDELDVVNVVARPGLDLGAVQLALDCVAETPQCLRLVTSQHEAQVLVAPTLARTANELVLTLLRFDARSGKTQRVLKRQPGQNLSSTTLDSVPAMLRELFGVPEPKPAPASAAPIAAAESDGQESGAQATKEPTLKPGYEALRDVETLPEPPMEAPGESRSAPIGPLLLGGGGVVLLGAGLVMGLTVVSAEDDRDRSIDDLPNLDSQQGMDAVNYALDRQDAAKTNAVITNVFLGLGSAVLVASGIWLAVDLTTRSGRRDDRVQVAPLLGKHEVGFVLTHRGAGL